MRGARRCLGFSLLEVIVSLALFALAVTVLASAYVNVLTALNNVQVDQHYEQDMALIRREALLSVSVDALEEGGDILTGRHGLATWRCEYETTFVADLFRVEIFATLFPEQEQPPLEAQQVVYVTRPDWSDPLEREALRAETRQRYLSEQIKVN